MTLVTISVRSPPIHIPSRMSEMRMRPLFAWYDLWIGVFWDRKSRKLYILPVPCLGVVITFRPTTPAQDTPHV